MRQLLDTRGSSRIQMILCLKKNKTPGSPSFSVYFLSFVLFCLALNVEMASVGKSTDLIYEDWSLK